MGAPGTNLTRAWGDARRTFRQHHPGAAAKHPCRTTTPCDTVTDPPADRATSGGRRSTGARQRQPAPATPANTRTRARSRHHRPSRRHEPSHKNRQHALLRLDDVPPRPSSATTCGLPVSFRPSNSAGRRLTQSEGTASRRSKAGPAPARSAAVTPHRRRALGGITEPAFGPRAPLLFALSLENRVRKRRDLRTVISTLADGPQHRQNIYSGAAWPRC